MKILFLHTPPDLYGASRSLLRLTSRLVRDGNNIRVVLGGDGPLRQALEEAGVTVAVCPRLAAVNRRNSTTIINLLKLGLNFVISGFQLWSIAREFKPNVIHTNTSLIVVGGVVARWRNTPHIWHVREVFTDFESLWKWYESFLIFFSTRIVCVSQAVAQQFRSPRAAPKLHILYNGFPIAEFPAVSTSRINAFRVRYNLNGNLLVGLVGRIKIGRKGQDVFLKAASGIRSRFPNVRFLLIGSPFPGNEEQLPAMQRLISELKLENQVIYTGDVEDIKAAYAALDVTVQASVLPEAFSGVVIEAMAMGKPVVASNCGAASEQIENNETGMLVEPGDVAELGSALIKLLESPVIRQALGRKAHEKFLECFEFERFYKQLLALYASSVER
jgi:glycosyltransferase involved in cell wall biosynthesis